jgi:hypothetical protein
MSNLNVPLLVASQHYAHDSVLWQEMDGVPCQLSSPWVTGGQNMDVQQPQHAPAEQSPHSQSACQQTVAMSSQGAHELQDIREHTANTNTDLHNKTPNTHTSLQMQSWH